MDKSFFALHQEIEEGDLLDEVWPKVKLTKARDQHEYDFLAKTGRSLDKTIKGLQVPFRKEFARVRDDIETRAEMLRLADNRGWSAALQIVGNNNKMMEKYKKHIPLVASVAQFSGWNYNRGFVATNIREKGFLLLYQVLRKESLIRKINEEIRGFISFVAERDIVLQVTRERLPASTVEVLATLPLVAHPQALVLEEPINIAKLTFQDFVVGRMQGAVSDNWNHRLDKAWELFKNYCKVMSLVPLPSEVDTLVSFIVWLDLTQSFA
ncbi:5089_t:CDS:2, partial [Dentiscutata heterogama]